MINTPSKNGILAYVSGQYLSQGNKMLPKAGPEEAATPQRSIVLDVPDLGPVRITYELNHYRHYKSYHWHWVAKHAERASSADEGDPALTPPCPF